MLDIVKILVNIIYKNLINPKDYEKYINFAEDRPFNDFRYSINSEKLENLGWKESVKFLEGVNKLVQSIIE